MPKLKINKEKLTKYFFIALSVVISVVIIYYKDSLANFSEFGYLGIFLVTLLGNATVILPAPAFIVTYVGGSIYNPVLVAVAAGLGATIGELTGFMAGYGGKVLIEENKKYERVRKWMEKSGFLTLLILAAIPNPIFDIAGMIAGATGYPLKKFILATILGKIIKFLVLAFIGKFSL